MNKRSYLHGIAVALTLSIGVAQARMAPTQNTNSSYNPKPSPSLPTDVVIPSAQCQRGSAKAELDINNVRALLLNRGDMFWDGASSPRYEVPKVIDPSQPRRHSLFSGAVWIGGVKAGTSQQHVCGITYGQNNQTAYFPGQLDDGTGTNNLPLTSQARCNAWNHLFKVNAATVSTFKAFVKDLEDNGRNLQTDPLTEQELDLVPEEILNWPGKGNDVIDDAKYPGLKTQLIYDAARIVDINKNGIYEPAQGEFPRLPGVTDSLGEQAGADQVVFWITNDAGGNKNNGGATPPAIGMEIHTEGFAYQSSGPLNTMTFYRQKLINKGNITLDSTYFAQFIDPDLGNPNDDYVGCDVERGLGICYNGDNDDEGVSGYGQNPPTIAVDFFRGAVADPNDGRDNDRDCEVDEEGELIMMSSFAKFTNGAGAGVGDPSSPAQFYNFLKGLWGDGLAMTYDYKVGRSPVSSATPKTQYIFPGSSDLTRGWSVGGTCQNPILSNGTFSIGEWSEATVNDNPVGDRRFVSSGGPFRLLPGAVNELTIGVVWAKANSGGALGSYNLLLQSDDIAQKSFDNNFSRLQGPNAPDMEITELDGELIISLTPDEYLGKTTETYTERDPSLKATDGDIFYHFQGYMLYQLANSSVTDYTDPTQARLIMQCDVKDGVSKIINQTYDYTIDALVSQLMVNGEDKGIKPYLSVKTDAFTGGKLINHKKYYYHVKAYAYNGNTKNDTKFIQGDQNLGVYSAIPHKVNPEMNGTATTAVSGYELPVTRLSGTGNGGNALSLSDSDEQEIVTNRYKSELLYKEGGAPITVKIYDPKSVVSAQYKVEITSRLAYKPVGGQKLQVNDTIESTLAASAFSTTSTLSGSLWLTPASPSFPQAVGKAVVVREVNTVDGVVNVDVKLLNGDEGGTFVVVGEKRQNKVTSAGNKAGQFSEYTYTKGAFNLRRNGSLTTNFATAEEFVTAEYVTFIDLTDNTPIYLKKTLSIGGDELIPNRGLAVSLSDAHSPSQRVYDDFTNGYLGTSGIEFPATSRYNWLVTVPDAENGGDMAFIRTYDTSIDADVAVLERVTYDDPALIWTKVLSGSFFPYTYANDYSSSVTGGGIGYYDPTSISRKEVFDVLNNKTLYNLGNVDIVFTNDKSKWTRVPVIQVDTALVKLQNYKSRLRSLNSNFEVDLNAKSPFDTTQISRGMSWFPGYAIDLDRGIRLNMMFSESVRNDVNKGNNLKWEPSSSAARAAEKSFIYIVPTKYDEGKTMEFKFDSTYNVIKSISSAITARDRAYPVFMKNVTWVGVLALLDNPLVSIDYSRANPLPDQARLKLRVKKSYTPYLYDAASNTTVKSTAAIPTYNVSSVGMEAKRNETQVAKSALDLIRVVPNPYYAYSSYETSQVDNRVKITNLPTKCRIRIYNLGGSLIREFNVDYSNVSGAQQWTQLESDRPVSSLGSNRLTSQDWDLKNQVQIPIASGVYLIHIDAGSLGEKTIKWCGGVRPIDLDALQN